LKSRSKLAVAGLVLALAFGASPSPPTGAATAFADASGHWAAETIDWGVEAGVARGFPNGEFRPDDAVTEAQFAAMLFRAFPGETPEETGPYWHTAYYEQAQTWMWPLAAAEANTAARRGKVAQIIAASLGKQLDVEDAVQELLDRGLAQGRRTANGRVDFGERETLTRAEAVQFVRNVAASGRRIGPADRPPAATVEPAASVSGIAVGDAESTLRSVLGEPNRKERSEYGFVWYVYNADYERFAMVGVSGGKVRALYGNGSNVRAGAELGEPLTYIQKGNVRYRIDADGEYDVYDAGDAYVTVFYDIHEGRRVSAVQAIEKQTEQSLLGFYGEGSDALADGFERISLDLANSARARRGLSALAWDDGAAKVALGHSADMAASGFFDHTNLLGEGLGDRLERGGVAYRSAGENIAYGQTSAIFAHEGWMNSTGHRINLLGDFNRLGVGVAFAADSVPYYTQNFLKR